MTTLLRVPYITPSTQGQQVFTCVVTMLGAILFAFFNAEVALPVHPHSPPPLPLHPSDLPLISL